MLMPFQMGCSESLAGLKDALPLITSLVNMFAATQSYDANSRDSSLTSASMGLGEGLKQTGANFTASKKRRLEEAKKFKKGYKENQERLGEQKTKLDDAVNGRKAENEQIEAEIGKLDPKTDQAKIDELRGKLEKNNADISKWSEQSKAASDQIKANEERLAEANEAILSAEKKKDWTKKIADQQEQNSLDEASKAGRQLREQGTPEEDTTSAPKTQTTT
jgi:chromosome segregation ATPase